MGIFGKIFTWWDGATLGTHLWAGRQGGEHVGTDYAGNKYYRKARKGEEASTGSYTQREQRWVIYNGLAEASRIPVRRRPTCRRARLIAAANAPKRWATTKPGRPKGN